MSQQKDVFLASEGDAWYLRNRSALDARDWSLDLVCRKVLSLTAQNPHRVLEIGCGDGARLEYLARQGHRVFGVDPSDQAVSRARERGVEAVRATADALPVTDGSFDIAVLGFCLYLCDDEDLFRIAQETDRAIASSGWALIFDFEAPAPTYRPYHHAPGIRSRKMDYKSMFLWHPAYTLASHEKLHHMTQQWTDDPNEWVSLACLRKCVRSA